MRTRFAKLIKVPVLKELVLARKARHYAQYQQEFQHLENAHVLGQNSTYWHTRVHCLMLAWAKRQSNNKEFAGQLLRIMGAATKTAVGLVPEGNTGGTNMSPFKSVPLSEHHARAITHAKR